MRQVRLSSSTIQSYPTATRKWLTEIRTLPYIREGTENFLKLYGPAEYHSAAEYPKAVGSPLPATIIGGPADAGQPQTLPWYRLYSRPIRRPKSTSLLHGAKPWQNTTERSIGCISTALSTLPRKCPLLTRPWRRMEA